MCETPFGEDVRLPKEKVIAILNCLVEGASVRATSRLCDVTPRSVLNMLVLAGERSEKLVGKLIANIPCKDVECHEIWGYVYKKEAHKTPDEAHDT
ncbi:MAG: hypothetical protein C5B51_14925 [Terriglobia bacterium]|nr:MAG: hypothetical protein C5B51_14925 [Terriglobia bacterium]